MKKHFTAISLLVLSAAFIFSACGGGGSSPSPPFSQADLEGEWYISILQSSPSLSTEPGWIRGTASIDASGNTTINSFYTSATGTFPVPQDSLPQGVVWTINPWTGIISESSGTFGNPDFHGKLASNKKLIVGTATNLHSQATTTTVQLRVLQKLDSNATYSITDLANKTFTMHQIDSGASDIWTRTTGTTDDSGNVWLGVMTMPTTTQPGGIAGTLSIDSQGIVSLSTNTSSFQGMLSPDKTYMVATETNPGGDIYRLTIVQMVTGKTYNTSDLAGSWHFHGLVGGIPAWIYQSISFNDGIVTHTSQLVNGKETDPPAPGSAQIAIDGSGNVINPGDDSFHGTLSSDMLVTTQTITDGQTGAPYSMLGVTIK